MYTHNLMPTLDSSHPTQGSTMMFGLIDLNTVNTGDETASLSGSPSSSAASANSELAKPPSSAVCMELWYACAGPLISLPKKGSAVVYFPQGHVEHLPEHPAITYDLPPHVFCRVIDVKLHADSTNDEVYALVSLVPDPHIEQKWRDGIFEAEEEDVEDLGKPMTPHMFCKTLTASDTSTHGGFSVPRRAAEDCFPPLDYKQQRPSQELVAKDLHGIEWKFRHIYRGQPRRHLLTTGWSAFVNKKKLTSGDAVLFLRGGDGELRLGIRRAAQIKSGATILAPNSQQFNASSIAGVMKSISMQSTFNICYNPRGRSFEIILPYQKFSKSLTHSFSSGMRFKIRFETEDSSQRSGLIIGVSDVDPVRWPGSKWKCLLVRWDDMEVNCLCRVSPWEIEPSGPVSGPNSIMLPGAKRSRVRFPTTKADFPALRDENGMPDFGEPLRIHKVLQGQEVFGFRPSYAALDGHIRLPSDTRCLPGLIESRIQAEGNSVMPHHADAGNAFEGITLFNEPFQFHKVLQGQETVSIRPYGTRRSEACHVYENNDTHILNGVQVQNHGNSWSTLSHVYNTETPFSPLLVPGSPPPVLMLQQSNSPSSQFMSLLSCGNRKKIGTSNIGDFGASLRIPSKFPSSESTDQLPPPAIKSSEPSEEYKQMRLSQLYRDNQKFVSMCKKGCRLFGFPLTEGKVATTKGDNPAAPACNEERLR
ncbi:auxin response factor 3-like isoform X1 [Primulina huaijiensis]|uniref:auxin response factor 3-like isoform X1 n=2 Tax=Primulina huaijiensis TaxID=1492673 RepID=UPI003CC6E2AD